MSAFIYKITGADQKIYVGSTTMAINKRLNDHRSEARTNRSDMRLHEAMRAQGPELFTVELLALVPLAERYTAEGEHIVRLRAHIDGHNVLIPGRTNAVRRRLWRASNPDLLRGQRQRRAVRLAERRRANINVAVNQEDAPVNNINHDDAPEPAPIEVDAPGVLL